MNKALLTWPAGKLKDAPALLSSVYVLIAIMIFGQGNWENPLCDPPHPDPKKIKHCFDSSNYTPLQCLVAFRIILAYERGISTNGGFGFVDVNTVVVEGLKGLEYGDLEEYETHFMDVESLEQYFCTYLGWEPIFWSLIFPLLVLRKPCLESGMFRLMFLHRPFCFATFWNPSCTKVSLKRLRSMARTIMQCQVS